MSKSLVIVESPTKARTLRRFLGGDMDIQACMGHIRDLPERKIGVDIRNDFNPTYVLTKSGHKVAQQLRKAARQADQIYLATDPDREGEAIAWHLQEILRDHTSAAFQRVTFHEITRAAVSDAFAAPSRLDLNKVDAQQARRILDRLVGYKVSPLLWRHVKTGTSAGRVQSVALRLVCEREREIQDFTPVEYWNMTAVFGTEQPAATVESKLYRLDGSKPHIPDGDTANAMAAELQGQASFKVADTNKKERRQRPSPPFITSTLQQIAGSSLRYSTRRTMQIAQQLYEGVDLGSEGAVGLITYMRTDSVAVSREARDEAAAFIQDTFGRDYVPGRPNVYRSRSTAQAAHEAIRPTDVRRTPESLANTLSSQQLRLYRLIWNRFVASQMAPAKHIDHTVDVEALGNLQHAYLFRATARTTVFPGFLKVYREGDVAKDEQDGSLDSLVAALPELEKGTACRLDKLDTEQKFTQPPNRFTEATLVRELEQNGVGRPSTYSSIVNTIQSREYVTKEKAQLVPTPLGFSVNDFLVESMPQLFQVSFTAEMESRLDEIEEGALESTTMLQHFYDKFRSWGGEVEMAPVPERQGIERMLDVFHDNVEWTAPAKRGRRTFDDRKFFESLKAQLAEKGTLSDKQWRALLALAARYADQLPDLQPAAAELGLGDEMKALIASQLADGSEPGRKAAGPKPTDETLACLQALRSVKDWAPPASRGRKTYDDRKFFESLRQQAEDDKKAFSSAQQKALRQLTEKYHEQIEAFDELAARYGLKRPEPKPQAESRTARELVNLLAHIDTWAEPRKRGRRTYDDQSFADSVRKQFESRGTLTEKQAAALRRMLGKYRDQIPDYGQKAVELDLPQSPDAPDAAEAQSRQSNEPCPECGAALTLRRSRRGPFYGCSAYPKCRFTKPADSPKPDA